MPLRATLGVLRDLDELHVPNRLEVVLPKTVGEAGASPN